MNTLAAKQVSHKNKWNTGTVQVHVGPPLIPLIKSKNDNKLDRYYDKIKFRRDKTSENSYPYEFKMTLFDNGKPEEFLLLTKNLNTTLKASGTIIYGAKNQ